MIKRKIRYPKWEEISGYKKIADVNVGKKCIEGWQIFSTCLKNMDKDPNDCLRRDCIISRLILALLNRGAKL